MNGQAKQNALPAASSATTVSPRQPVHGSTPARFMGLIAGPRRPSATTAAAAHSMPACTARRAAGVRKSDPSTGRRSASKRVRGGATLRARPAGAARGASICTVITAAGTRKRTERGHPHDRARRHLVVERGEPAQARHRRVCRVEHAVREGEERGEDRVLDVGQQQVERHRPARPRAHATATAAPPATRRAARRRGTSRAPRRATPGFAARAGRARAGARATSPGRAPTSRRPDA